MLDELMASLQTSEMRFKQNKKAKAKTQAVDDSNEAIESLVLHTKYFSKLLRKLKLKNYETARCVILTKELTMKGRTGKFHGCKKEEQRN